MGVRVYRVWAQRYGFSPFRSYFPFWITKLHRLVVNVILAMAPWAYNSVLLVTLVAYYRILTIQQAVQTNVHTIQGLVRVLG